MTGEHHLIKALMAGAADLRRNAALLDEINVFPVMDADTGKNMSAAIHALEAVQEELASAPLEALPRLLETPLIAGARGNSGIILSQFLSGFFRSVARAGAMTLDTFRQGVSAGRDRAYQVVSEPREGTMLTLMTAMRDLLQDIDPPGPGFQDAVESQLAAAVLETRHQMADLERAGVVDSGALGFHLIVSGLTLALTATADPEAGEAAIRARLNGATTALLAPILDGIDRTFLRAASRSASSDYRYCVNLLIETSVPVSEWPETPDDWGSSVNVATSDRWVKLHIHSNAPDAICAFADRLGKVTDTAIQDMWEGLVRSRRLSATPPSRKIRIAADSAISLDHARQQELGILRLEHSVNLNGRMVPDSQVDLDELLRQMSLGHRFTTAQISPADTRRFFDSALRASDYLIFIAVGNAYTGTQSTVRQTLADYPDKDRIRLLDSRAASGQQTVACIAAARFAEGTEDLDEVAAYAKRQIAGSREYLVIDDLTYLTRSGRIGKIKAAFASFLSIKPIVGHGGDGAVTYAKVKSHEAGMEAITERVFSHPGTGDLLILIEYTDNLDFAQGVARHLKGRAPEGTEILLSPLSSSSAVHMGPGTWGVAVTRR